MQKMRVARAVLSCFPLLTNNITAFWRCRCLSRSRFLNSLLAGLTCPCCLPEMYVCVRGSKE